MQMTVNIIKYLPSRNEGLIVDFCIRVYISLQKKNILGTWCVWLEVCNFTWPGNKRQIDNGGEKRMITYDATKIKKIENGSTYPSSDSHIRSSPYSRNITFRLLKEIRSFLFWIIMIM